MNQHVNILNQLVRARFGWPLLLLVFFFSSTHAENRVQQISVIQQESVWTYGWDFSHLKPGETYVWVWKNQPGNIREESENPFSRLHQYSLIRWQEAYDTFDCLTHELWMDSVVTTEANPDGPNRGGVLKIPGKARGEEIITRGKSEDLQVELIRWRKDLQPEHFQAGTWADSWQEGDYLLVVRLAEGKASTQAVLLFESGLSGISTPFFASGENLTLEASSMQLYLLSTEGVYVDARWKKTGWENGLDIPVKAGGARKEVEQIFLEYQSNYFGGIFLYARDIGQKAKLKCEPCTGPPPNSQNFQDLGWISEEIPEHWYFSVMLASPGEIVYPAMNGKEDFQVLFRINHEARGFVQCEEAKYYFSELKERRRKENEMLSTLLGGEAVRFRNEE